MTADSDVAPTIRIASFTDLPQIVALRRQWGASRGLDDDAMDSAGTVEFADRVRTWWERQGDTRVCWLAFDADRPIAMANLAIFERSPMSALPLGAGAMWGTSGSTREHGAGEWQRP